MAERRHWVATYSGLCNYCTKPIIKGRHEICVNPATDKQDTKRYVHWKCYNQRAAQQPVLF